MEEFPKCLLVVTAEVDPEVEDEWNRWYDTVHVPDVLACPGVRRGQRFATIPAAAQQRIIVNRPAVVAAHLDQGSLRQWILNPRSWPGRGRHRNGLRRPRCTHTRGDGEGAAATGANAGFALKIEDRLANGALGLHRPAPHEFLRRRVAKITPGPVRQLR